MPAKNQKNFSFKDQVLGRLERYVEKMEAAGYLVRDSEVASAALLGFFDLPLERQLSLLRLVRVIDLSPESAADNDEERAWFAAQREQQGEPRTPRKRGRPPKQPRVGE